MGQWEHSRVRMAKRLPIAPKWEEVTGGARGASKRSSGQESKWGGLQGSVGILKIKFCGGDTNKFSSEGGKKKKKDSSSTSTYNRTDPGRRRDKGDGGKH